MTVRDIVTLIEETYPTNAARSWDHVGLLLGSMDWNVYTIYVALDATDEVLEHAMAVGADLIITHHPVIFGERDRVTGEDFVGRKLLTMAEHKIACYAMHTNYDAYRMGALADRALGLKETEVLEVLRDVPVPPAYVKTVELLSESGGGEEKRFEYGFGTVGNLEEPVSLYSYAKRVKECLGIASVKVFGNPHRNIRRIAVLPGSGKSEIDVAVEKGADVLITGDIDHHSGIDALQKGIALIDAGHYGIEHLFIEDMKHWLLRETAAMEGNLALAPVTVYTEDKKEPFWVL